MRARDLTAVCVSVLLFVFSCVGQDHGLPVPAAKAEVQTLEFGQIVEREIAGLERHSYKIALSQNQFVKIEAVQNNCDIILSLESPDKINVVEYKNDNSQNGTEIQTAAVTAPGEYELKIICFEKAAQKGKYSLRLAELRPATDKELSQTSGFQIINRLGKTVSGTATTEQIRQYLEDFKLAREKFRFAENRQHEARALSAIGSRYTELGNWGKAIELQKEALEINRASGPENIYTAILLLDLGASYLRNNEPHLALQALYESAAVSVRGENLFNESRALSLIGNVYEEIGDAARAQTYYAQALEKAQALSQDKLVAVALNDLGKANLTSGENQKALEYFQRSVELARRTKNKRLEAAALGNLGQTFVALGEAEKADGYYTEAIAINRSLKDKIGEAAILRKAGKLRLTLGKTDEAIGLLDRSQLIYRSLESSRNLAETLLLLAQAALNKGDLGAAQSKAEEAVSLVEKLRTHLRTSELRDPFSSNLRDFYALYIETLMARHKLEPEKNFASLAFQANEAARARGLLNLLAESGADIRRGVDEKLLQKEAEIRNLLSARLENLTKVLGGSTKKEIEQELKNEIEGIRAEHERVQSQIRAASPRYAALTQPRTLSLQEIQASVLDADTVLVEYFLGRTKSFVWVATKTGFHSVELPASERINSTARQFYDSLTARNKDVKFETPPEREARIVQADADFDRYSRELGDIIVAPIAPLLRDKRLLVAADGALQYVPFAALTIAGGDPGTTAARSRFLIESNEIVSLPSASALAVLRKETAGRPTASRTLAVLADPIFDKKDERFQTLAIRKRLDLKQNSKIDIIATAHKQTRSAGDLRDGLDLVRLPFTRREAEMIASVIPDGQKEKWLDFDANRRLAASPRLANYRYVHFATHGLINDQNPELSGLVFSTVDENGKDQDGFLRVGDVYNLKLPAEMVVLSGCRTGMGKEIRGEGIVGMTRAFMYAGAKRVTVSLWDINDEATSELMSHYYREMFAAKKRSPAAALRQAQNTMLKDKRWSNPYFWATFVLQGEPN